MAKQGTRSDAEWRDIIDQYVLLRDLERTDFQRDLRRFIAELKRDSVALYRAALRLEIRARDATFDLTYYGAGAIRRRLAASKFDERHFRFTDKFRNFHFVSRHGNLQACC